MAARDIDLLGPHAASKVDPTTSALANFIRRKARQLFDAGDFAGAKECYQRLPEADRTDGDQQELARCDAALGGSRRSAPAQIGTALPGFDKAETWYPAPATSTLPKLFAATRLSKRAAVWVMLAVTVLIIGALVGSALQGGILSLPLLRSRDVVEPGSNPTKSVELAEQALSTGDNREAQRLSLQALNTNSVDASVANRAGNVLWRAGDSRAAEQAYKQGETASPAFVWNYLSLAQLYKQGHKLRDAQSQLRMAVSLAPGMQFLHYNLGIVELQLRMYRSAIADFNAELRRSPAYGPALAKRAEAMKQLSEPGKALAVSTPTSSQASPTPAPTASPTTAVTATPSPAPKTTQSADAAASHKRRLNVAQVALASGAARSGQQSNAPPPILQAPIEKPASKPPASQPVDESVESSQRSADTRVKAPPAGDAAAGIVQPKHVASPSPHLSQPTALPAETDSKNVVDARFVVQAKPEYPDVARQMNAQGSTVILATIGPRGNLLSVRVDRSSGSRILDESALRASRASTYEPARIDGKPVTQTYRIVYVFSP
ncbi:MAG: TonB family protein [Candidatus Eremiobacteraeota bacterium]|nr:TonB family protein [Candidatus Eremiobacteraeota bacterium]